MHRRRSIATILALVSLVVAACGYGGDGATSAPPASVPVATVPAETDVALPPESLDPNLPPQSETDWGRIWNAVPPFYPVPAAAKAADADHGPVSGAYAVASKLATARAIGEFYRDALEERGFGGTGLDGPLEDGSFTVWSSNGYGCESLVTILPRDSESLITVLYGAGCQFN